MSRICKRVRRILHQERVAEPMIEEYVEGMIDSNTEEEMSRAKDHEIVADYRIAEPYIEAALLARKI